MGVTTIVLAGDRTASHPVFGANKALLPVAGRPLVAHVVRALADVPEVDRVFVVGPEDRLTAALAGIPAPAHQERHIAPQGQTMYDNVWQTFLRSLSDAEAPDADALARDHPDAVVFVIAGDLPLLTPGEVRDFLARADMAQYDYVLGITPIEALGPFAPRGAHTGIRMAAINVAEGGFRQNNLHLVRPFRVVNKQYIEEFYEARYQKQWWNVARVAASLALKHEGRMRAIAYFLRIQVAMRAQRHGWNDVLAWARRGVPMADVCSTIGHLLRTRFTALVCPCPGAVLDIDNEHDLATLSAHFTDWRRRLLMHAYGA